VRGGQGEGARRDQLFPGLGATIALKRTLPAITDASGLTIFGGETAKMVVSGDNKVRVLVVKKDARLTLRSITIANDSAPEG